MCNCERNECSICIDQINLWLKWHDDIGPILAVWRPNTRNENDLRLGQYLFNHLCGYRMDVADKIRGSIDDPFYNDEKIRAFLEKVDELWTV